MSRVQLPVEIQLVTDTIFSSGFSLPGGEDISVRTNSNGQPYLAGATLKGLLREQLANWLHWSRISSEEAAAKLRQLLGDPDRLGAESAHRLTFSDWQLAGHHERSTVYSTRAFTALENGIVKEGSLRSAQCLNRDLVFSGTISCHEEDTALVSSALRCIKWVGLHRNRGFGNVRLTVGTPKRIPSATLSFRGDELTYRLFLETPLGVSSVSREKRYRQEPGALRTGADNFQRSLNYIPGSTIRGMVVSQIAEADPAWFETHKEALLSDDACFTNALPIMDDQLTIPTPLGFYADKRETEFYNVLISKKVSPGHKRAKLGAFCYIDSKNALHTGSPKRQSIMRICRGEDKQVFSSTVLLPGSYWQGTIRVKDDELKEKIAAAFREMIWLGADRYAGYGCCRVLPPLEQRPTFQYEAQDAIPTTLYLMALSPLVMTRDGQPVGLDEDRLAELLKVGSVTVSMCATSTVEVCGFNSTWGCATPSVVMYDQGSVFCLTCSEAPAFDRLQALERTGLGIRTAEGFGQVAFLKAFEGYSRYAEDDRRHITASSEQQFRHARCRWLLETRLPKDEKSKYSMSASQIGTLQSLCEKAILKGGNIKEIKDYFAHNTHNRQARHAEKFITPESFVMAVLNDPIRQTLALPETVQIKPQDDTVSARLRLLIDLFDILRKNGGKR